MRIRFDSAEKPVRWVAFFEDVAATIDIRSVPGINRCALVKSSKAVPEADTMQVEGMNLEELWKHPNVLNLKRLTSNDISAMLRTCVFVFLLFFLI